MSQESQPADHDWNPRRRPALLAVIPLIIGITCYRVLPPHPALWLIAATAALAVAATLLRRSLAVLPLLISVFFCGLAAAQLREFYFRALLW